MEAMILAGGMGTRIRPLTYSRPKPLLPILNQTMLEGALAKMPKAVKTVVLPVNYLGDLIREHFDAHPDPRLVIVDEPEPLGTGGAIKNCQRHFTGPFLVCNADIVSSLSLDKLVAFHRARRAEATISLWPVDEPWHFGVVRKAADGRIQEFVEKPPRGQEPSLMINAGNYVLELSVLDQMEPGRFTSLEREVFAPMAANGSRLYGMPFEGYWIDCGRPDTYLEAHRRVLDERGVDRVVGQGVEGLAEARVVGYAVGNRVRLGRGAVVERSVLLDEVVLGPGAVVRDSVLGRGVEVEARADLSGCVVGDYAVIEGGAQVRNQRVGLRPEDA